MKFLQEKRRPFTLLKSAVLMIVVYDIQLMN